MTICSGIHHNNGKNCSLLLLLTTLVVSGCPDKSEPGDSATEASTGTSGLTSTGSEPPVTTSGGTGGSVCQEACEHLFACKSMFAPTVAACVSVCMAELNGTAECASAAEDYWGCLGDAPCGDAQYGPGGVCNVPYADYTVSCVGCPTGVDSFDDMPGKCGAWIECTHLTSVSFFCEGDSCTCRVLDEEFVTCPAADVCAGDDAAVLDAAAACCEMPFILTKPL